MTRRLTPLPHIGYEDIAALKRELNAALDAKRNPQAIERRLNIAIARKIRSEIIQERKARSA